MNNDRRKSDDKIEFIYETVSSIRERQSAIEVMIIESIKRIDEFNQRQNEVVLPMILKLETVTIKKIEDVLFLKGGLCEVSHASTNRIIAITERMDKIPTIVGWIFTGLTVGAGAILWLFEHFKSIGGNGK